MKRRPRIKFCLIPGIAIALIGLLTPAIARADYVSNVQRHWSIASNG